ncbi:hypothetical protein ACQKJC_01765 [Priestia koreensis]|uniref:hypothetical protein n=1 Tax=Priestia koreensis TaxID=284581 RepID=UPI003D0087CA
MQPLFSVHIVITFLLVLTFSLLLHFISKKLDGKILFLEKRIDPHISTLFVVMITITALLVN